MIRKLVSVDRARAPKPFEPVVRERVIARLVQAAEYRVTLVTAPAGFGKSVAIKQYLERSGVASMRFGLRREHASLAGFVRGLAGAIEQFVPNASHSAGGAYERAEKSQDTVDALASWLTALLEPFRGTIVVDDLHVARNDARIGELVAELVDRTGDGVRWLISTRDVLELPVASWLAYARMDVPIDESELRLSESEAFAAAEDISERIRETDLRALLEMTGGWPTAFSFALRASGRSDDFQRVANGTREMVYAFLAEQVYRGLDDADREFLRATCLLPLLDVRVLDRAGFPDAGKRIGRLRRQTAFIGVESDAVFRYHDLFRDFLEHQLRDEGTEAYRAAARTTALTMDQAGDWASAISLLASANETESLAKLLSERAWEIADRAMYDVVDVALGALAPNSEDARIETLRAALAAFREEHDRAEALYVAVESWAPPADLPDVAYRHVLYHVQRGRVADALHVLDSLDVAPQSTAGAARFAALKATVYAQAGRTEAAQAAIAPALSALNSIIDPLTRVAIQANAAIVLLLGGDRVRAKTFGETAVAQAEAGGFYSQAARAGTMLALVASDLADFPRYSWILAQIRRNAERSGDTAAAWVAISNAYDFAAQRGDADRIRALEDELEKVRVADDARSSQTLTAAVALQSAWVRDFDRAFELSNESAPAQTTPSRRALRYAEAALYASAAGRRVEAEVATEAVAAALLETSAAEGRTFRVHKARLLNAIAALLLNRVSTCNNSLRGFESGEHGPLSPAIDRLLKAARALYVQAETSAAHEELVEAIRGLEPVHMGGFARLFEILPLPTGTSTPQFAALTKAEFRVLQLLAEGYSSRTMAVELGRSALTIDSHVKSIVKKLNCDGRREAVALARAHGLL